MYSFLSLIHTIIFKLFEFLQPFLVPICFILAWGILLLALWNMLAAARDGLQRAKAMHQIPCAECKYFTNQSHLKCPVHPVDALTEKAIDCPDFEVANPVWAANLRQKANQDSERIFH